VNEVLQRSELALEPHQGIGARALQQLDGDECVPLVVVGLVDAAQLPLRARAWGVATGTGEASVDTELAYLKRRPRE